MGLASAASRSREEYEIRRARAGKLLPFGVKFLDDALLGILPNDLILIGARSGAGKTQLCTRIALANVAKGSRVNFIALEAESSEIEARLKFSVVMDAFYADRSRPKIERRITFQEFYTGLYGDLLRPYEEIAHDEFTRRYGGLFVFYKASKFGVSDLIEQVVAQSDDKQLIIIDHAHYFDFEDDNENRALKQLARTVRTLALEENKPIILVAHLRKRDRGNTDIAPDLDEFHGSSDLAKIATRVITLAPGGMDPSGCFETFFRIPKNRFDGGATRFMAQLKFDPRTNSYGDQYRLGWADQSRKDAFTELDRALWPSWATGQGALGSVGRPADSRQPRVPESRSWEEVIKSSP